MMQADPATGGYYDDGQDDPYAGWGTPKPTPAAGQAPFSGQQWVWGDPGYDPKNPPPGTAPFSPSFGIDPGPAPAPAPDPRQGNTPGMPQYGAFSPSAFNIPDWKPATPFNYPDFVPLSAEGFKGDPGYEFRRTEGMRGVTNAASAQGGLLSGNTLTDLASYNSGLASQEFGNAWQRGARGWEMNRNNQADIYDRNIKNDLTNYMIPYQRESDEYGRELSTYNANAGTFQMNQGVGSDMFGRLLSLYSLATKNLPTYSSSAPSLGY